MENRTEKVNPEDIQGGDTIIINGGMQTVGKKDIIKGFCGIMICGFNARKGIDRVLFPKWSKGQFVGYVRQL